MPQSIRPPQPPALLARLLVRALPAAMVAVCGVASCAAPAKNVVIQADLTSEQGLTLAQQAAGRKAWAEVLLARHRAGAAAEPGLVALAAQAAWQLGDATKARVLEDQLVLQSRGAQGPAARREIEQLAALHLGRAQRPAAALRLVSAAMPRGCETAESCRLAAKALALTADGTPAWFSAALAVAPAAERGAARQRWLSNLASDLVLQTRATEARELLLRHAAELPNDPERWAGAYAVARKQPGLEGRSLWLQALLMPGTTTAALAAVADHPELSGDRAAVAQILALASQRPDADASLWRQLAAAWMRLDDRRALTALTQSKPALLQDVAGRHVLARALLAVRILPEASAVLAELAQGAPADAVTLALQAEWQRQAGQLAAAKATAATVATATGDRSLAHLILAQAWRTAVPEQAERFAELAADTPGAGQLAAARLRAQRLFTVGPTKAALAAVKRLTRLLGAPAAPGPGPLGEEREPTPAALRQEWAVRLSMGGWAELQGQVLAQWASAGVATADQRRKLALRSVQQEDLAQFLALDEQARRQAESELVTLDSGAVLQELSRRSALWLARWLAEADVQRSDEPSVAWRTARQLLRGGFAVLGLRWLQHASQVHGSADISVSELQELAQGGGAQAVLDLLNHQTQDAARSDPSLASVRVMALVALGRAGEAEQFLMDLAAKKDWPVRNFRPLLEVAGTHGLCRSAHSLALRMAAEPDLYGLRSAMARGLDCARRQQNPALAQALLRAAQGERFDASRTESIAQMLAERGFEGLAIPLFESVQQVRPINDESLIALARAHLLGGNLPKALETLRLGTTVRGRVSRMWVRAAELLEDYSHSQESVEFFRGAVQVDPDATRLRVRLVLALLRSGQPADAAQQVGLLAQQGATEEDYRIVLEMGQRAGALRALLDAVKEVADADRDLERFRVQMAAELGDRPAVVAGVRRLRAKGAQVSSKLVEWLERVGALSEAREAAEDGLASAEPSDDDDRIALLEAALRLRHDPTSAEEALAVARLFVARALDADRAWALAAVALSRQGMVQQAEAAGHAWKTDRTLSFGCLRARFAWDAGKHDLARQLWAEVRANILLDGRTRDTLRSAKAVPSATERRTEVHQALLLVLAEMSEVGLGAELLPFYEELLGIAPDSELIHARKVQTLLALGRAPEARQAWNVARQLVRAWGPDLAVTAEKLAQAVGTQVLLADVSQDGPVLRSDEWWLPLVADMAARLDQAPELVRGTLEQLLVAHPEMRVQWTIKLAQRGLGEQAAAMLGSRAFACRDDLQDPTARAAAAALSSMQGRAQADNAIKHQQISANAAHWLQVWLSEQPDYDRAVRLGLELLRQGHPELAAAALRHASGTHVGYNTAEIQMRRALASIGAGDDDQAVAAVLQYLRGQRSNLVFAPGQNVRGPVDDVFDWLITAGRTRAAALLAEHLRREEPGQDVPAALDPAASLSLQTRLAAWDFVAAERLSQRAEGPPLELAPQLLAVLTARSADLAWAAAERLARAAEEPWRIWVLAAETAMDFDEPAFAQRAVHKANQARAPVGATACLAVALAGDASPTACIRGRAMAAWAPRESAALASALARQPTGPEALTIQKIFIGSPVNNQRVWLAAAAAGQARRSPTERANLGQWLRATLATLEPAPRQALVVLAMEDLGELGLGDLGVQAMGQFLKQHPNGHGYHNNLAYALHLAGEPTETALPHALHALWATGGEPAYAALDTLAAILHRDGRSEAALPLQRQSLAAALSTPTDRSKPSMALPWARYCEFLMHAGRLPEARQLAIEALRRSQQDGGYAEDFSATARLRRVLKATSKEIQARSAL